MIVTIDGTSGSGKTTIGQALATALGVDFVSSGCVYRAAAYLANVAHVDLTSPGDYLAVCRFLRDGHIKFVGGSALSVDGRRLQDELRQPSVERLLPLLAGHPCIRTQVEEIIRSRLGGGSFVIDGRDMGTIIFPHADFKFFFARSHGQISNLARRDRSSADEVAPEGLFTERDLSDLRRPLAPMLPAADARVICPFDFTLDALVTMLVRFIETNAMPTMLTLDGQRMRDVSGMST